MRHNPILHLLVAQPRQGVERTPGFKSANALIILAFEEEIDPGPCGGLAFEGGANEGFRGLGSRGEVVEGFAGEDGGAVDVGFDEFVGGLDGGAREGKGFGDVAHFVFV